MQNLGGPAMAWLEIKNSGQYHVAFRFGNQKFKRSLRTSNKKDAEAARIRIDENIRLVERGRLTVPENVDIAAFLLSDGRLKSRIVVEKPETVSGLIARYRDESLKGAVEKNSWDTINVHLAHIERLIGKRTPLHELKTPTLQRYIEARSTEFGKRGRLVSPTTIRKEVTTFSSVWIWASGQGLLKARFPNRGLKYPKGVDRPPFQTWRQIERRIERGGLSGCEIEELWDCLYLRIDEIQEVLLHVKEFARHGFIFPMMMTAAHTGARRSELMRAKIDDFDLVSETVQVHEKKRVRGRTTNRVVPISKPLASALHDWFQNHPGGQSAFCLAPGAERLRRKNETPCELTVGEAEHHFKQTFSRSKWEKIRGWHTFRHSFASNCAATGIDQRMINEWMGHQTEAMVRRYRHLFPDQQQNAVNSVFT